jgi:hypothetical protein
MNHFLKIKNMKISKISWMLMLSVFSILQVSAQTPSDPSVNGATVNPAPLPAPGSSGSGEARVFFNFANATSTAIPLNPLNVINVSLSKLAVNGAFTQATNISTTGGNYFAFTYNTATNTITATQIAPIPGFAFETITISNLLVTGESPRSNPNNGLNVNVAFLATYNPNQNNDNTSAFTYTGAGGTLPIRLLSFNGLKQESSVQLKWQTSSEQNSNYFEVQFSPNGNTQWTSIGKVNAAGTSSTQRNYSLIHNSPIDGVNYYRLKQVDVSGNYAYSNIVPITFTIKGVHVGSIYPNPFMDRVKIDISSDRNETVRIQLTDNVGRILKVQSTSIQKGVNPLWLEGLSGLAPGVYNIEVKTSYTTYRVKLKK